MSVKGMRDGYGRTIDYLRISVTDKCNLRCRYCMPSDIESLPMNEILTFEETVFIAENLAGLGITKIRVTGGEPLIRRDIAKLVGMLKDITGVEQVTLTTNGVLLKEKIKELITAGLDGINISIDTLDPDKYRYMTGHDGLPRVLEGMEAALKSDIPVKINAVSADWDRILNCDSINEYSRLIELARNRDLCVRFIEMMPIGYGKDFPCVPHSHLIPGLIEKYHGMEQSGKSYGNGPAVYYDIPGFKGKIGFISAINNAFCDSCNRVRLTTTGFLKTCLCYDRGVDLKGIIRCDEAIGEKSRILRETMEEAILCKPKEHSFADVSGITEKHAMSAIGG